MNARKPASVSGYAIREVESLRSDKLVVSAQLDARNRAKMSGARRTRFRLPLTDGDSAFLRGIGPTTVLDTSSDTFFGFNFSSSRN